MVSSQQNERHNRLMLLLEPPPTSADLRFACGGISVRVTIGFWVMAALFGWGTAQGLAGDDGRSLLLYLAVWTAVVFISILIHELGHALAFASCGQASRIVLYHFGGLTVPVGLPARSLQQPSRQLAVSAAGPLAQLAFVGLVIMAVLGAGYRLPASQTLLSLPVVGPWLAIAAGMGQPLPGLLIKLAVYHLLVVNIFWAVLNLLPVLPLDGGQIVREALRWLGVSAAEGIASLFGLLIAGILAFWFFQNQELYLAVMFALLAVSCWQRLVRAGIG